MIKNDVMTDHDYCLPACDTMNSGRRVKLFEVSCCLLVQCIRGTSPLLVSVLKVVAADSSGIFLFISQNPLRHIPEDSDVQSFGTS
jgi:hypothetical protein